MIDFEFKDKYDLRDFQKIISVLRGKNGCPWDREQTHESIRRNFLEETYEVCEAIDQGDIEHMKEELGDVLMQVIFHCRIEEEQGGFNIDDVADGACKKLILRHPHVFGDSVVSGSGEVLENWDEIKRRERSHDTVSAVMDSVAKSLPALWRAEKVQKKAAKVGFDWEDIEGALTKTKEELSEVIEAKDKGAEALEEELGDLLFSAVNVARFAGIDPEMALHKSCEKFIRRFSFIEQQALSQGKKLESMSLDDMEKLYQIGKSLEN